MKPILIILAGCMASAGYLFAATSFGGRANAAPVAIAGSTYPAVTAEPAKLYSNNIVVQTIHPSKWMSCVVMSYRETGNVITMSCAHDPNVPG